MNNQYWKRASIIEAWQFDPKNTTIEAWDRSNLKPGLYDVVIDEAINKSVFMNIGDWYVTEYVGKTKIEYVLSSEDFNKVMEPYEEEEHRVDINPEIFFNL